MCNACPPADLEYVSMYADANYCTECGEKLKEEELVTDRPARYDAKTGAAYYHWKKECPNYTYLRSSGAHNILLDVRMKPNEVPF